MLKPRLRPYLDTVALAPDRMLFRGGREPVVLRGSSTEDVLPALLPLLDGTRSHEAIVAELPWIEPHVVEGAMALLEDHRLLEDGAGAPPPGLAGDGERHRQQSTYWLFAGRDRYGPQIRLAEATAVVLGLGAVGSAVAQALAEAGVGRLLLGESLGSGSPGAPLGHPAQALCGRLDRHGDNGSAPTSATVLRLEDEDQPEQALEEADFAVVCSDSATMVTSDRHTSATSRAVNEASLATGTPWLRAVASFDEAVVGPTVIPRETACFDCFLARLTSNLAEDDFVSYQAPRQPGAATLEAGTLIPFAGLVAHYAALEVVKHLAGIALPVTAGAVVELNARSGAHVRHPVLKVPRCPACSPSRTRPQMRLWDVRAR